MSEKQAHCADPAFDPEWWYPEPVRYSEARDKRRLVLYSALEAIEICHSCPLMANGKCLENAMKDTSTIDYGIFAGTLAVERMQASGLNTHKNKGLLYQIEIRQEAEKRGFFAPAIPKMERMKPYFQEYFPYVVGTQPQQD